jgi:catechol 2,3-dioxygenase-like lactoylglutathione lyase family enzyme
MASTLGYDGGISIGMPVSDLDASIAWYSDVLGFSLAFKVAEMGWAEMATETAGVTIGLSQVEQVNTDGGATVTLGVTDVRAARAQLEAKDVRFDGETQVIPGMVTLVTLFDPDGNTLMLYQDTSQAG